MISDDEGSFSGFGVYKNYNNLADDIFEQASQNMSVNFAPMLKKKLTGSAKGMRKRKPGQSKTGEKTKAKSK